MIIAGAGTVTGVPDNHVIIARFTDELSDITLKCTVENKGIQTDTVWKPDDIVAESYIFGDGRRASSNRSDSTYGNHLTISAELMKGLDGKSVSCGSHANPHQAIYEFHIQGKFCPGLNLHGLSTCIIYAVDVPRLSIDSDVHLWEGTTDCTINKITAGPLVKLKKIVWSKDKNNVKEGFQEIAFKHIMKHDGGLYIVAFHASSHDSADPRLFKFSFTLVVMCKLTYYSRMMMFMH